MAARPDRQAEPDAAHDLDLAHGQLFATSWSPVSQQLSVLASSVWQAKFARPARSAAQVCRRHVARAFSRERLEISPVISSDQSLAKYLGDAKP